ncbi:hypothetical protein [Pedobacter gandavensis]|uniref:hypothetical protein n=1 Tax=Pedobacter gandavensis TaxID=2679963 RepID=UPI00292D0EF4|nr:hypothetical protein [Pedobacter gandavensis]
MKWFVCLFSLYVLFLTGVPCNLEDNCCPDEICIERNNHKKPEGQKNQENCPCSPFFACSVCFGVIPATDFIASFQVSPAMSELNFFYSDSYLASFSSNIWQPPKLV